MNDRGVLNWLAKVKRFVIHHYIREKEVEYVISLMKEWKALQDAKEKEV